MKQRSSLPRTLGSALVTTLVATVATVGGLAGPAAAETVRKGLAWESSWTYVDSARPTSTISAAEPHVPIGSWRDASNVLHTTRSYITFDGASQDEINQGGSLVLDELWAANCSKRAIEVWQTENISAPTWNRQPKALKLLGTFGNSSSCLTTLTLPVNELIINAGQQPVTFMVRVPAAKEADTQYGRRIPVWNAISQRGIRLLVDYVITPQVDNSKRLINGQLCASGTPPRVMPTTFGASVWDRMNEAVRADFAFWPVNDPTRRTVVSVPAQPNRQVTTAQVPEGAFTQGQGETYGWAVQAVEVDEEYRSPWSTTCTFVVPDLTAPAKPTVTSSNYPEGGTAPRATPGQFTFAASGSTNTVAYQYGFGELAAPLPGDTYTGAGWIKPTTPGGSATVTLVPPAAGQNTLRVRACNIDQRCSAERTWTVNVPDTTPTISLDGPVYIGVPFTVTATAPADLAGLTSYDFYPFYATSPKTVSPNANGTGTTVDSVPETQEYSYRVAARLANGWVTPQALVTFQGGRAVAISSAEYPAGETSGGVGVPGTFTLTRATDKVTTFRYYVNSGTMIPGQFDANGRATINWTPTATGFHRLVIQIPTTVGGNTWYSMTGGHDFYVAG